MLLKSLLVLSIFARAVGNLEAQASSADEVVTRMIGRFVLDNEHYHKRPEMLVLMKCQKDGGEEFEAISSTRWSGDRNHVFPKLLAQRNRP